MKQHILSLFICIFLLAPMHIFSAEILPNSQDANSLDEQLYCSLVYVNKPARDSIIELALLFPDYPWSTTYKDAYVAIQHDATVMRYDDVVCTLTECLHACNNLPHEKTETIQAELEEYKKIVDAGNAHISGWHNEQEADRIITRNFDGSRDILQLFTRNLTVDGIETVNGLLTINGILAINGQLILNGTDINTVIANASKITGLTNHALLVGNAAGALSSLPVASNGQIPIGSTGADPVLATITPGAGISISNGPGSIMISATGGGGGIATIDGNSGSASATTVNIVGTGAGGNNITTSGDNAATITIGIAAPVSIANGGTNATSMATTDGTVIYDGTRLVTTATGTALQVLTSNGPGVAPTYQAVSASGAVTSVTGGNNITITGPNTARVVNVSGTTQHAVQIGNATNSLSSVAVGTTGQVLTGVTGADPSFQAPAASSISITGDTGGTLTGNSFIFSGGTTGLVFNGTGTTETLSGTVNVANGGTGLTSVTAHDLLVGNGTTALTLLAPSATTGIPLVSQGAAANPAYSTAVVAGGGTGQVTLTNHGVLVGAGTSAITQLAVGTTGQILTGVTGADPSFQAPAASSISITGNTGGTLTGNSFTFSGGTTGLAFNGAGTTETLSGTVNVANGGTGATTLTGVLIGNGTAAVTGNPITQFDVLVGGASNAITSITNGTTGQVLAAQTGGNPIWSNVSGLGIQTIQADTGSATGSTVQLTSLLSTNQAGTSVYFTASGSQVVLNTTDINQNIFIGQGSGVVNPVGGPFLANLNVCVGLDSMFSLIDDAEGNVAIGSNVMPSLTTGNDNVGIGENALPSILTGSNNVCIGNTAGNNYNGAESNNFSVNTLGASGESNTIRLLSDAGYLPASACFIGGIFGSPVTGSAVLAGSNNKLGTVVSSQKFKDNIAPMPDSLSQKIYDLKPSTFVFKSQPDEPTFGLIAEEVAQVFPYLVVMDKNNEPFSVKYHELPVLLLKEIQKLRKENVEMKTTFAHELHSLKKEIEMLHLHNR